MVRPIHLPLGIPKCGVGVVNCAMCDSLSSKQRTDHHTHVFYSTLPLAPVKASSDPDLHTLTWELGTAGLHTLMIVKKTRHY